MAAIKNHKVSDAPSVVVLGMGAMGSSLALRLLGQNIPLSIWNRSRSKCENVVKEVGMGVQCTIGDTAAGAIGCSKEHALVIFMLSSVDAVVGTLRDKSVQEVLVGRTVLNLCTCNADDGRRVAAVVSEIDNGKVAYIDGAYSGAPKKARAGAGQLFLSSEVEENVTRWRHVLDLLGKATFCGRLGASRAFDYAVVDLMFVNLVSFIENLNGLQREGVDLKQLYGEMSARLATIPAALEMYEQRMRDQDEASYEKEVTASLGVCKNYWQGRKPYSRAHGDPTMLTDFMVDLFEKASGGKDGPHSGADLSRIQEVLRYGNKD